MFHQLIVTKIGKLPFRLNRIRTINSSSVRKTQPALQIRWFLVECLGKMQVYIFPSFRQAGMFAVDKKVNVIFCSTYSGKKCSFMRKKSFVFMWFIECLLKATQAWLSTNTSKCVLDVTHNSLSMPSRRTHSFTVSTRAFCSASAVKVDKQR